MATQQDSNKLRRRVRVRSSLIVWEAEYKKERPNHTDNKATGEIMYNPFWRRWMKRGSLSHQLSRSCWWKDL